MPERKVVETEDAERFARQMKVPLFETSAKDNKNVEDVSFFLFIRGLFLTFFFFDLSFNLEWNF